MPALFKTPLQSNCGLYSRGAYNALPAAAEKKVRVCKAFTPNPVEQQQYDALYKKLYNAVKVLVA